MKNIVNLNVLFGLATLVCISLLGCEDDALAEFQLQPSVPTTVGSGNLAGSVSKTNAQVTVPVSIKLSSPASKAFEVNLAVNQEAAVAHIEKNNLSTNHVAILGEAILLSNATKVDFGADSAVFEVIIGRTEVEKYYGQHIVIGYNLTDAGKGNQIDDSNATGILILQVDELINESDIHYISLTNGAGQVLEAKSQINYESSSTGLTFPVGISLASFPGAAFTVDVATSTDTIEKLIGDGVLPTNTVALLPDQYTVPGEVRVPSNSKNATLELTVPWSVISQYVDKKLAVLVELTSSTLHVINPQKSYSILLIDSENVVEVDVTNDAQYSVSRDNDGNENENASKLIDNNYDSKFLLGGFSELECVLVYDTAQKIGAYTFTSGNDAKERDPSVWTLYGSNDGVTWEVVDVRSGEEFNERRQTRRFNVEFPTAYTHFKLHLTGTWDSSAFQMAEWRMIRIP